jgi:hypothetical protein
MLFASDFARNTLTHFVIETLSFKELNLRARFGSHGRDERLAAGGNLLPRAKLMP